MADRQVIVAAKITITNRNGACEVSYQPEFVPQLDLVRLAILYLSTIIYICANDGPSILSSLGRLTESVVDGFRNNVTPDQWRERMAGVAEFVATSLELSGTRKWRKQEEFKTELQLGNTYLAINKFSMFGYRPNTSNSAVFLFCDVATRLDDPHLLLLAEAMLRLADIANSRQLTAQDSSRMGFVAAEATFRSHPEWVPLAKVHPVARDWKQGESFRVP